MNTSPFHDFCQEIVIVKYSCTSLYNSTYIPTKTAKPSYVYFLPTSVVFRDRIFCVLRFILFVSLQTLFYTVVPSIIHTHVVHNHVLGKDMGKGIIWFNHKIWLFGLSAFLMVRQCNWYLFVLREAVSMCEALYCSEK